jgi:hypothetical protein
LLRLLSALNDQRRIAGDIASGGVDLK